MKTQRAISCILALLVVVSSAEAQSGDWQVLQTIPQGTEISVKRQHRHGVPCLFERANSDKLYCETVLERGFGPRDYVFDRSQVREVRVNAGHLGKNGPKGAVIGAGIGAGFGLVLDLTNKNDGIPTPAGALLMGMTGSLIGLIVGGLCFRRGQLIYRRQETQQAGVSAAPDKK